MEDIKLEKYNELDPQQILMSASAIRIPTDIFKTLAISLSEQYRRKNAAYGDSFTKSVEKYGNISALTRMSDKWNRLETLMLNKAKNEVADESINDTLLDLASYCIMTVMAINSEEEVDKLIKKLWGVEKENK